MLDRKKFFAGVRASPFDGKLSANQVGGMSALLDEWDRRKLTDLRWLGYMLGTPFIETARTMQPIKEYGGSAYYFKMYDPYGTRPKLARKNGNTTRGDGVRYCGRGYVQLTWKNNYARLTKLLRDAGFGIDLVANPDLAMRPDVAAFILFEGMIDGLFTGRRLDQFFNDTKTDWTNARRIINGTDRATEIGTISKEFFADLTLAAA